MHLAVLSDVHGSLPSLEAVLEDLKKSNPDHIIVAGDMVSGPNSIEVLQRLQDLECWMIRGNNENYMLRYASGNVPDWWFTCKQFGFIRWTFENLDIKSLDFIQSLSEQRVLEFEHLDSIRVVHGSPRNTEEHLYPGYTSKPLKIALSETTEPVLVCGHTHIPWTVRKNGRLAFNPGAVCGSINGNIDAHYALLTWNTNHWEVEHHSIPYDLDQLRKDYFDSGILEENTAFTRVFLLTIETGKNIASDFLPFAYKMAHEAGHPDCEYIPDDILDVAVKKFPWNKYKRQ